MHITDLRNKRILMSALNWGFGHVTRSIGILQQLQEQNNTIVFAGSQTQIERVRLYFPCLQFISVDDYPFGFKGESFIGDLIRHTPQLLRHMRVERRRADELVKQFKIDLILSDHRYGFRSNQCVAVFITHQYRLPLPWFLFPAQVLHKKWMQRFDHIWVLDDRKINLAGKLSRSSDSKVTFIGFVSRYSLYPYGTLKDIPVVLVASGPLSYARAFIQVVKMNLPEGTPVICAEEIVLPHGLNRVKGGPIAEDMVLLRAERIISRCGYSTLMDLQWLKCKADLTPTPGQLEQEYLDHLHKFSDRYVS